MIWVFWHGFARSGIFVSIMFIVFDLATGLLLGVVFQMAMLLGYVLLGIVTSPPYWAYVQQQQRYEGIACNGRSPNWNANSAQRR